MRHFIKEQSKQSNTKGPTGYRWSKDRIRLCSTLYSRSPAAYRDLRDSGYLRLPSGSILKRYRNCIKQDAGFNPEVLDSMRREVKEQNLSESALSGGLVFDEMEIEEDLQTVKSGEELTLVGFVDLGDECENLNILLNKKSKKLANHVLLFHYLGNNGFRFPFVHFPTAQASATDLYVNFWKAVSMLRYYGFSVVYCSLDGAITNRQFIRMHSSTKLSSINYTVTCPANPTTYIIMIMDIKLGLRKIWNNFYQVVQEAPGTCFPVEKKSHGICEKMPTSGIEGIQFKSTKP